MRKVLIPTDFSENAMNAISYALELFKYERSEFLILHAFADEVYDNNTKMSRSYFEEYKENVREKSDRELQEVVSKMLAKSPNPRHEYNYLSVFGSLIDAANDLVDKENMDALVMGTRGYTDDRNITFGSNTLQVMKYVKCPVLAVPASYHDVHPNHILFPTDYQLPFKRREIKLISTLAKSYVATITCLYVSKFKKLSFRQTDNKSLLTAFLEDNKTAFVQVEGEDITSAVNEYITTHDIDLLVMINSRHSYFENILYTSTIQKIGLNIQIPFLVLQNLPRN
jgi:nucleotide-binding universal stress UspA family protein